MDIDDLIDEAIATLPRGARNRPTLAPTVLREITQEDFVELQGAVVTEPWRPLERVRHTHHLAARTIAEGRTYVETSEITGYTPVRIGQLMDDPTFQELVRHYKAQVDGKWLNVQERLASLGLALTEEMMQRLDETPEKFSNEELRRWAETLLDRSGNGPSATRNINVRSQNQTVHLIEKIKLESGDNSTVRLLAAE